MSAPAAVRPLPVKVLAVDASDRRYQLRDAMVQMAIRYGSAEHRAGLYFARNDERYQHWDRVATRRFAALQRLATALRDAP